MKKIVPFKKDILFNSNVSEITSISLEHDLKVCDNNTISGNFTINGEYRMSDNSVNTESFNFELPCSINLDERYILDNALVDIDDFYYEVVNSNILEVNIDVSIDRLEEKEEIILNEIKMPSVELEEYEDSREENTMENEILDITNDSIVENDRCIEKEDVENVTSLFDNFDDSMESYQAYRVYIVREGDTLDSIIQKYGVNKEDLEQYNDLNEINLGDKIIIPELKNEKD